MPLAALTGNAAPFKMIEQVVEGNNLSHFLIRERNSGSREVDGVGGMGCHGPSAEDLVLMVEGHACN